MCFLLKLYKLVTGYIDSVIAEHTKYINSRYDQD